MPSLDKPPTTPPTSAQIFALIACGGVGARAGDGLPKQYRCIAGKPMVSHSVAAFAAVPRVAATLVAIAPHDVLFAQHVALPQARFFAAPCAGPSRAVTVRQGLDVLLERGALASDWALVHDAARCLITPAQIEALMDACESDEVGGLLALALADTLKQENSARSVLTLARADKWLAQTPQMFRIGALMQALDCAGQEVTDEASAMERMGYWPLLIAGSAQNFKVTYPEDFAMADALLTARMTTMHKGDAVVQNNEAVTPQAGGAVGSMRIGEGWDTHQLVEQRPLILGGVQIPFEKGLLGHSDADVLCHAVVDALFGAAALGDIGRHFPDTDSSFQGADSIALLQEAMRRVRAAGYALGNVDATVIAQAPKLAPYLPAMTHRIAQALGVSDTQVNIKAKTYEKLGPVGQGQSMEARAVVMLWS